MCVNQRSSAANLCFSRFRTVRQKAIPAHNPSKVLTETGQTGSSSLFVLVLVFFRLALFRRFLLDFFNRINRLRRFYPILR